MPTTHTQFNQSDLEKLRLLVVDDQQEARSLLRNMLGELGITQIFESGDGKEALGFMDAASDMIDVVVCDWNMPRLNGMDLLRQLRSANGDIPFLMVTGRSDMGSVLEAKTAGVTAYIRKPFSPAQLEVKLRVILHNLDSIAC